MSVLPKGWAAVRLVEVCGLLNGRAYRQTELLDEGKYPVLRVGNFFSNRHWYFSNLELEEDKYCDNGDLLYAWSASFGPKIWDGGKVIYHYHIWRTQPDERAVATMFLYYWFAWDKENIKVEHGTGSTMIHVTKGDMEARPLLIPPLAEQRRIVAKLDALTARLARARAELDRVQVLAEKLRMRSTFSAISGYLTADWRVSNPSSRTISDDGLDAAYLRATGSPRRKPWAKIDWCPKLDIPASWRWVSVDQIVAQVQYGSSAKTSNNASGIPVLRMGNIQRGQIDWKDLKYLPSDHDEFPNLILKDGDVLFNRTNSFELVGKSAVYKSPDHPSSFASYLIRVRPSGISSELLAAYLNSSIGRSWIETVASQQVGQANVNGSKLKALGVPLPPFDEQAEIVRRLNSIFTRADRLEAEASRARALLDRLEAAILAKAFKGELVPQDPNDEPASVLLERIRAGRASTAKPKRSRHIAAAQEAREEAG